MKRKHLFIITLPHRVPATCEVKRFYQTGKFPMSINFILFYERKFFMMIEQTLVDKTAQDGRQPCSQNRIV